MVSRAVRFLESYGFGGGKRVLRYNTRGRRRGGCTTLVAAVFLYILLFDGDGKVSIQLL